jgi:hypothetical protein
LQQGSIPPNQFIEKVLCLLYQILSLAPNRHIYNHFQPRDDELPGTGNGGLRIEKPAPVKRRWLHCRSGAKQGVRILKGREIFIQDRLL